MASERVLILDDELPILDSLSDFVRSLGFDVCPAQEPDAALDIVRQGGLKLAIVDVGAHGLQVTREATSRNIPCIMMSGRPVIFEIGGLGPVLQKPFSLDTLRTQIRKAIRETG